MRANLTSFGLAGDHGRESQDAFAVRSWDETVMAVVADGAGGARAGREASRKIADSLLNNYAARPKSWSPQKSLVEFTEWLNHRLYRDSLVRWGAPEMVSTVAAAVIEGDKLYALNVGDSRIYLSRAGDLRQLSQDHACAEPGRRHVLERAVGIAPEVTPYFFETDLADGDVVLLCSDGVSNVLGQEALGALLRAGCTARTVVTSARRHAAPETLDDMSAVVLHIIETGKLSSVGKLPLEIPVSLHKGDVIGGFTLVRPFQQSDRVWLATRGAHRFTIKFAPVEARDNEAVLNQFVKETWNATCLQAPEFFVKAFLPENATVRCYVMEFVEAPSLKMLLRSRRLAAEEAIALGQFLLAAGQHLLAIDLVHGDIKPENILVLNTYDSLTFKLVDFGSATEVFSVTSRAGTPSYLAPERFHEAPISERTEIFAVGTTLFEALTGTFPYGEIERFQTPHFGTAKRPSRLNPNLPPWL
ncbi:MAG: protein phosphatase 2C domain-containing protein, partial [Verrucomicrobia bacterium]|nr:protein phosphatase 2C domain-containing protein [Verrucomicrobiota bacterium]